MPHRDCFTRGKETRHLLYKRLGGPQGRSERLLRILLPPGFDLRTLQSVASRYTEYSPVPYEKKIKCNSF